MTEQLYGDLADWWPVISPPSEYAEEATLYVDMIRSAARRPVREVLELGSGGGNNASHLKRAFELTLVEPADGMRELSRVLNPECTHVAGDMRDVRLGRIFDAVFVHDAVVYMTTEHGGGEDAGGGRATSSGRCRLRPAKPPTPCTTRSCCESPTGPCVSPTTCTARGWPGARRGCGCLARSNSPRRSRHGRSRVASTTRSSRSTTHRRHAIREPLSERELEVLVLLAAGRSNRQIASELFVALSTVKTHIKNIYGKLDVRNRTQAVSRAGELGLL